MQKRLLVRGTRFIVCGAEGMRTVHAWNFGVERHFDPHNWHVSNQMDYFDNFVISDVVAELPSKPEEENQWK